jgi:hypothetical protein
VHSRKCACAREFLSNARANLSLECARLSLSLSLTRARTLSRTRTRTLSSARGLSQTWASLCVISLWSDGSGGIVTRTRSLSHAFSLARRERVMRGLSNVRDSLSNARANSLSNAHANSLKRAWSLPDLGLSLCDLSLERRKRRNCHSHAFSLARRERVTRGLTEGAEPREQNPSLYAGMVANKTVAPPPPPYCNKLPSARPSTTPPLQSTLPLLPSPNFSFSIFHFKVFSLLLFHFTTMTISSNN